MVFEKHTHLRKLRDFSTWMQKNEILEPISKHLTNCYT